MEARKITVVSTRNQSKSVIMSAATTLGELKADLSAAGIDYSDMAFYEGTAKVELKSDDSALPKDVPYKGTITNELVFMLTNTNKKIKSGADRLAIYAQIKSLNLVDSCKRKYGKNFTQCKTDELLSLIEEANAVPEHKKNAPVVKEEVKAPMNTKSDDGTLALKLIKKLINLLYNNGSLDSDDYNELDNIIIDEKSSKKKENKIESSYSDDDIDDMFEGII